MTPYLNTAGRVHRKPMVQPPGYRKGTEPSIGACPVEKAADRAIKQAQHEQLARATRHYR